MKKIICLLIALVVMTLSCVGVCAQEKILVLLDGEILEFDQQPVIIEGRTLVPLRGIFEPMGATVGWDDATQTVTAVKDDISIKLTINDNILYKNGDAITLDVPAQLIGSRTMVPARAVSEAFDAKVGWIEESQTITIVTDELLKEAINTLENADEISLNYWCKVEIDGTEMDMAFDTGINKKLGIEYSVMSGYVGEGMKQDVATWMILVSDQNRSYIDENGKVELKDEPTDIIPNEAFDDIISGFYAVYKEYEDDQVVIYSDGSEASIQIHKETKEIMLDMPVSEIKVNEIKDDMVFIGINNNTGTAENLCEYLNQ